MAHPAPILLYINGISLISVIEVISLKNSILLGATDSLNSHLFLALSYFRGDVPPDCGIEKNP